MYRPPGLYTDFLKEFADFLSELLVKVNKALIVGDFNIHVDNTNDALGLAFTDLIHSFGVKQNVTANVPSIVFFLLSKTFLYWADISATWAKTFFIPDLYSAHKKSV